MTIHARPTPLRPLITSVTQLDAYLAKRLEALAIDCYDEDVRETIGALARARSSGKYSELTDLRGLIAGWLSEETAELEGAAGMESIEQRYKDAYGPEPLAPYQAEGR